MDEVKIPEDCLLHILLGAFLNNLTHVKVNCRIDLNQYVKYLRMISRYFLLSMMTQSQNTFNKDLEYKQQKCIFLENVDSFLI